MYSRILVPLDGSDLSENVLPFAITLGQALECPIALLRIPENVPLYASGDFEVIPAAYTALSDEERKAECEEYLEGLAGTIREKGLEVSTVVRIGMPGHEIVEEAAVSDNTVVAMASHGRSGISRWVMGSVADEVLRNSTSPLLLVRPQESGEVAAGTPVNRIIVPVDGSALAEQVFPHVADLAKAFNTKVDLVRVTASASEYYRQSAVYSTGGTTAEYIPPYEEFSEAADSEAQTYLGEAQTRMESLGVSPVEGHLVHGQPAVVVADLAQADSGSMVVIATHGRSGIGRWVLGNVADSVARHSGCPVLLVRAQEETQKS
ncbi:MAG: universal stress protein [SAR202 cluster bacterium]|nr:universal stress protein [SAR202 cluster bacterium]